MGQEERAFRSGLLKGLNPTTVSAVLNPRLPSLPGFLLQAPSLSALTAPSLWPHDPVISRLSAAKDSPSSCASPWRPGLHGSHPPVEGREGLRPLVGHL